MELLVLMGSVTDGELLWVGETGSLTHVVANTGRLIDGVLWHRVTVTVIVNVVEIFRP